METLISARLTPRAAANRLTVLADGSLAVRVTAPPADGRANEALCRTVAGALGLARSRVTLVRGHRSRNKLLRIEGMDEGAIRRALAKL
jgi:uncharacterized protein YggU (UPF0235/DUF167 family)